MARFTSLFTSIVFVASAYAAPLHHTKRIAQITIDAPQKWRDACNAANGGGQCTNIAVTAAATLLAAAANCDQQDSADQMVDLGKQLNSQSMVTAAQIFVQQPRNSPNSVSVPYCNKAPKNSELNGLFQCQFQGSNPNTFVGGLKVGDAGTIPFGLNAALNPLGSCPANPSGPIADGTQLSGITSNPGTGASGSGASGSGASGNATATVAASAAGSSTTASSTASAASSSASAGASATVTASAASSMASTSSGSASGFQAQNAKDAQALNAKFASLTANSSCNDGDQACIGGGFAQCVGGKFQVTQCSGGTQCFALPLVNKAGTSLTCDTAADAAARIAATGVSGGVDGSGSSSGSSSGSGSASSSSAPAAGGANVAAGTSATLSAAASAPSAGSAGGFQAQNAKDAQALNAKFASLTANSPCNDGDQACVGGGFAQCVGGKFQVTQCSGGTQCFALPLVNKRGTSITCDTASDAAARMSAAGVSGGVNGSS
ncbi:hypothetical protein K488DRAFT_47862 [Vararia minispora EC-137]|uniref:Uncharacterized protein n=1 Tax=Vararia minispora EC-137 TaxID=1314806 RepID=A0ACB8QNG4_9AGAM|nr:hypothetical protein K488DRAFT_47862 [Vararia minispora EC-137]